MRSMSQTGIFLGIVCLLCCGRVQAATFDMPRPTETAKPSTLGLDALREQITNIYRKIRALKIAYVQEADNSVGDGQNVPKVQYSFAYRGEKRMKAQSERTGSDSVFAFNDKEQQLYSKDLRRLTVRRQKDSYIDIDAYARALGIPLSDAERATADQSLMLLPNCLGFGKWHVLTRLQTVDNKDCHVLEGEYGQRIWVDADQGVIRMLEISKPIKGRERAAWPPVLRYYYARHSDHADGVRLPMYIAAHTFESPKRPEGEWGKPIVRTVLNVQSIGINNDVSDSLFTISVPSGTDVMDVDRNKMFRVGDTTDGLDKIVADEGAKLAEAPPQSTASRWLVIVNVVVVVAILAIIVSRRIVSGRRKV